MEHFSVSNVALLVVLGSDEESRTGVEGLD
jgi:hypothetical protein